MLIAPRERRPAAAGHVILTDFLLARITEREAIAGGAGDHRARILAESWAQRQLVHLHEETVHGCREDGWPCMTLRIMALPYAENPHYDSAWRPANSTLEVMTYGRHRA